MARKIRFPLKMKNGAEVRTLDELKENFDLESVLGYFADGKLTKWLADRYYDEKAAAVSALSADMPDLNAKLCEILEVEYQAEEDDTNLEFIQRCKEKLRILNSVTDDREILDNIAVVALNQNDLFDILDTDPEKVYMYGEKFSIPFGKKAAEQGFAIAQCNLGYMYQNGYGVEQDYSKAIEWYRKAAEQDYARAQNDLGYMYKYGYGVGQDYSKAVEWYRKAAANGNIKAEILLTLKDVSKNFKDVPKKSLL